MGTASPAEWSATLFFLADLHGWLRSPKAEAAPGVEAIAVSLAMSLRERQLALRAQGFTGEHHVMLLVGGDALAYDSPICGAPGGPGLVMDCLGYLAQLVGGRLAVVVGNHDLEFFEYGEMPLEPHSHPDCLFACNLKCRRRPDAFMPQADGLQMGPVWVLGIGGGKERKWRCQHSDPRTTVRASGHCVGQFVEWIRERVRRRGIALRSPVRRDGPYVLATHVGRSDTEIWHGAEAVNTDHLYTLVGHLHESTPAGAPPKLASVQAYGSQMAELWVDARAPTCAPTVVRDQVLAVPPTPLRMVAGPAAPIGALVDCRAHADLSTMIARLSGSMLHNPGDVDACGSIGWHVAFAQYRAAASIVRDCSHAYLPAKAVRVGAPQKYEYGLGPGEVSLLDAWAVLPHPTKLLVVPFNADEWDRWVRAIRPENKLHYAGPLAARSRTVHVATSSWALAHKPMPKPRGLVRDVGLTRDAWVRYLAATFPP